jgi:hypothetical protein
MDLYISGEDICLANSATTHTIPRYKQYFSNLRMIKAEVNTISGSTNLIESFERTNIMLLEGTRFIIDNVLFSIKSRKNLQSFKDIHRSRYHIEIVNDNGIKYLHIVSNVFC